MINLHHYFHLQVCPSFCTAYSVHLSHFIFHHVLWIPISQWVANGSKLEVYEKFSCLAGVEPYAWAWVWVLDDWIILKVRQTVTLQPLDQQRFTVPLLKDLDLVFNIISAQLIDSICKIGFALSKWPNLHRAYLLSGAYIHLWKLYTYYSSKDLWTIYDSLWTIFKDFSKTVQT